MNLVGHVDGRAARRDICGCLQKKSFVFWENALEFISRLSNAAPCLTVDRDLRQNLLMSVSTSRVGVRFIDKLLDRMFAVTNDMRGDALGYRDKPIVYHKCAKIRPLKLLLDNDRVRVFLRSFPCLLRFLNGLDPDS